AACQRRCHLSQAQRVGRHEAASGRGARLGGPLMSAVLRTLRDDDSRLRAMAVHDRSFLVEAGAGSGKTAVMAGRIAMMLAAGIAPKHIAAVTFTELAASELLLRVRG